MNRKKDKYRSEYSIFRHAVVSILEKREPIAVKPIEIMPLDKCKLEGVVERPVSDK